MIITKKALPRRTILRGMGVAFALPFLDAMAPALSALAKAPSPMRLGFFYVPNGIIDATWFPKGEGRSFELSSTLSPLAKYKDQMVILEGLSNHSATLGTGNGLHAKAQTSWLSGHKVKETEGADFEAATTVDQYAAAVQDTPLRSLELGTEPIFLGAICEQGLTCVYQNTMSWRTPTTPLPLEHNPRVVFERLFGEGGTPEERIIQAKKNQSLLDLVTSDMKSMRMQLGSHDRAVVNDYFDAVREVERRIQQEEKRTGESPMEIDRPPVGIPESPDEHLKLLLDLQFLAYQADITRVVTFQIHREESQVTYPQIGVPEAHHYISHHGGNPEKIAMNSKINQHHVNLFSHLVDKMAATSDGDGSLLDHSMFLYGAGFGDGNVHNPHFLPLMLLGGANGKLQGGRVVKYPENTPMMNLGLTMLDKVDVEMDKIGDSTGRLTDL